jgi:acetyl-CoA carboxylase carboxyltransferase component
MGAQGAANIVYRRKLKAVEEAGEDVEAARAELIQDYEDALLNPVPRRRRGGTSTPSSNPAKPATGSCAPCGR